MSQLTSDEEKEFIDAIRIMPAKTGRKSYKLTRRMYEEILGEKNSNVLGNSADK